MAALVPDMFLLYREQREVYREQENTSRTEENISRTGENISGKGEHISRTEAKNTRCRRVTRENLRRTKCVGLIFLRAKPPFVDLVKENLFLWSFLLISETLYFLLFRLSSKKCYSPSSSQPFATNIFLCRVRIGCFEQGPRRVTQTFLQGASLPCFCIS